MKLRATLVFGGKAEIEEIDPAWKSRRYESILMDKQIQLIKVY
jgi:hypothetical protein